MYQNQKMYKTIDNASQANWKLLEVLFGDNKKYKLIAPTNKFSPYDGLLSKSEEGITTIILCEVKRREFANEWLINHFNSEFFLEKTKYDRLHKQAEEFLKFPGRECKILYINSTVDGHIYFFDITNKQYKWETIEMNGVTYSSNTNKKAKKVTKLNIIDAEKHIIKNIL